MATVKSHTDIPQSKKLAEFLPLESADMQWIIDDLGDPFPFHVDDINENEEPCWSLAALLNIIPYPSLHKTLSGWRCNSYDKEGKTCWFGESADNQIDACYKMIIKLHERKLL